MHAAEGTEAKRPQSRGFCGHYLAAPRGYDTTVPRVDALLAFAAALVSLRLSAKLVRRARDTRSGSFAAWATALAAFAVASGALAWGAAAGWGDAAFRVYYLGGALLSAPLLGVGSLLLVGRRRAGPIGLLYVGLAVGIVLAMPLQTEISGTELPEVQDVLEFWPARALAIVGNSLGTLAVVAVAIATFRRRPLGNALVLAGVAVAALGTGLAGLGVGALAPALAIASVLLYAGFVAPSRPVR
jgi:hypothetical protein